MSHSQCANMYSYTSSLPCFGQAHAISTVGKNSMSTACACAPLDYVAASSKLLHNQSCSCSHCLCRATPIPEGIDSVWRVSYSPWEQYKRSSLSCGYSWLSPGQNLLRQLHSVWQKYSCHMMADLLIRLYDFDMHWGGCAYDYSLSSDFSTKFFSVSLAAEGPKVFLFEPN